MTMRKIQAFGGGFDLSVARLKNNKLEIRIACGGKTVSTVRLTEGDTVPIDLSRFIQ